jgi:hypothetical protein
MLPELI